MSEAQSALLWQSYIAPRWTTCGNIFWYRRRTRALVEHEFMLVDIPHGSNRLAFDHGQLAKRLGDYTETKLNPLALPFTRIEVSPGSSLVQVHYQGRVWQYDNAGGLIELEIGSGGQKSIFIRKQVPSNTCGSLRASVSFTNLTLANLMLLWVGSENPSFHCWLVPGQTKGLNAYPGHVYMLRSGSSENSKVLYRVPGLGHHLVAVSEADLEERDDNDPDTPGDPNEALEESRWKAMEKEYKDILQVDCSVIGGRLWVTDGPAATFQFSADDQYFKDKLFPSPKGKYLIAWEEVLAQQTKDSPLAEYETFGDIPAILATTQDPLSGEPLDIHRPRLFDLAGTCEIHTDNSLFANPVSLHSIGWSRDEKEYRFIFNQRGQQCVRIIGIRCDGTVRELLEEQSHTFIDKSKMFYLSLPNSDQILWASERSGYNHLYMVDLEQGMIQHPITSGPWEFQKH
ncbi:unnamed protein product [Clonostachys rosea f. rosea IK726]|uniref:Uncharacterized protein n=1 Tax=Clonostachys rosea f. rosea IK726 TaxID=1349383 RepID=A0ACA9UF22_BIOOC|nr:unnamed protein product [Clonostachys rosea f. rosea IK726]